MPLAIPLRPVMRAAQACALGGLLCLAGFPLAAEPAPSRIAAQARPLTVTLKLDRAVYPYDSRSPASIQAQITLHNPNRDPVLLTFPSGQRFDLEVRSVSGGPAARWSDGRAFAMVIAEESIPPGDRVYRIQLPLAGEEGKPLPPGKYTARGWIVCSEPEDLEASQKLEIR